MLRVLAQWHPLAASLSLRPVLTRLRGVSVHALFIEQ